jgi:hypothetical protein
MDTEMSAYPPPPFFILSAVIIEKTPVSVNERKRLQITAGALIRIIGQYSTTDQRPK